MSSIGQNFVTPEGEFIDTTYDRSSKCDSAFNYYYSVGSKYPMSSVNLLKQVIAFISPKSNYSGNGYITFRFAIDCEGHMLKRTRVIQTDGQYKNYHFDKSLVNELFAFLQTLDKWKIASYKSGKSFSYIAVISFKIQNGKVINIIP